MVGAIFEVAVDTRVGPWYKIRVTTSARDAAGGDDVGDAATMQPSGIKALRKFQFTAGRVPQG